MAKGIEKEQKRHEPPDGGWGWMVVLGAALMNLVNQSMFANFGLIFGEKLKEMAGGHATGITLVMALSVVVTNFSGLLVGPLLQITSIRTINFIGILMTGSGLFLCSFSTAIWHICLAYSLVTGMGLGLLASGTFLAINDYFTTKKSTAVGLAMAGTGVGQMTMPTLIGMLLKKYQFEGTTLILGCMSFSGVIGALLFKPMFCCKKCANGVLDQEDEEKPGPTDDRKHLDEETTLLKGEKVDKNKGMINNSKELHYVDSEVEMANSHQITHDKEKTIWQKISNSLGLPLLKDLTYVHILFGLGFGYVGSVSFSTFFPMFLQDEATLSLLETTSCMTALSFADVLGRITVPEITRRLKLNNRTSFMIGCVFLGVCRSCLVELSQFYYIASVSFVTGFFRSITVITQNLAISEYIAKDKLPSAVGLNMMTKAILTLTFGQSLGLLKDVFSYAMCIHVLDIVLFVVVFCFLIEKAIKMKMATTGEELKKENVGDIEV